MNGYTVIVGLVSAVVVALISAGYRFKAARLEAQTKLDLQERDDRAKARDLAWQIVQQRIAVCRHADSTDPLFAFDRVYTALLDVLEGRGLPPNELSSVLELTVMRMQRREREARREQGAAREPTH
jgi:hypothetical protein